MFDAKKEEVIKETYLSMLPEAWGLCMWSRYTLCKLP